MKVLVDFPEMKNMWYEVSRVPCVGEQLVFNFCKDKEDCRTVIRVCHIVNAELGRYDEAPQAIVIVK